MLKLGQKPKLTADKRLLDTIYAEAGGATPAELAAVTSVFLNRADKQGLDKALLGSSAYRKGSKEYLKAKTGNLNGYEQNMYLRNKLIIEEMLNNPKLRSPWNHFENIKAFGEPSWAHGITNYKDIGRQRFYQMEDN